MSKCYLYAQLVPESMDESQTFGLLISKESWREEASDPAKGDKVLLVSGKGGALEYIQPHLLVFQDKDKMGFHFSVERTCLNPVPLDKARTILSRPLSMGANTISAKEYEDIVALMGGASYRRRAAGAGQEVYRRSRLLFLGRNDLQLSYLPKNSPLCDPGRAIRNRQIKALAALR